MDFLIPGIIDYIDIIIVALIIYKVFLMIRGTRAAQMLIGFIVLVIASAVAQWFDLKAFSLMISGFKTIWLIAFLIIFQPEFRRGLAELGGNRYLKFFVKGEESQVLDEIVKACKKLSLSKIGGIIVIEQEVGLKTYFETGTRILAKVSAELLTTIFTPYTPLHDGAVIIRGDTIVAAGCILPLTEQVISDRELGTRHRAALGLAEETDAIVIVISEETRAISLAHQGELEKNIDHAILKRRLQKLTTQVLRKSTMIEEMEEEAA